MKFDEHGPELDAIDFLILELLQENCKRPLAAIGEKVGLTAPSVLERIHKLEEAGVIRDYVAVLDARALGKDVTAFIGVSVDEPARDRRVRAGGRAHRRRARVPPRHRRAHADAQGEGRRHGRRSSGSSTRCARSKA